MTGTSAWRSGRWRWCWSRNCATWCGKTSAAPTASARQPSYAKIPREDYSIAINWGCNPDRTDELVKVVLREVEALKANGPTEKQVNDVRETLVRDFETNVKQNAYLVNQIYLRYQVPQDFGEFFGLAEILQDAERHDDLGRGEEVPGHRQLREGDAVPGEAAGAVGQDCRRDGPFGPGTPVALGGPPPRWPSSSSTPDLPVCVPPRPTCGTGPVLAIQL